MLTAQLQELSKGASSLHPARAARGFTLVELVTTIVLIGILGAVALPRFFDTSPFTERAYVEEVASALREAQRVARASECSVSVTINAADYSAFQRNSTATTCNAAGAWTLPLLRGDGDQLRGDAPTGIVMSPVATIVFRSDGSVLGGAPPVFSLGAFTITIDSFGGTVTVAP